MGYTALYRKYRPDTFKNVIGQEHIVRTLKNQIMSKRISHAYLFCGTRGTGKTSTAKIFAKTVNCLNLKDNEACNECELCKSISLNTSMNVIEIDAASNNGVDNIREIKEEVKYPPTEGKYKVYIIDEVHMLSQGAFNALLKTLEEPPEHVIFILATTDPQKVPVTILSRCQRFDFKRISINDITNALKKYLQQENVEADEKALSYIAYLSDGSMRDSLSILDQCLSFYYKEDITLEKVLNVTGTVDKSVFFEITDSILNKDLKSIMDIIERIVLDGKDIVQFVTELINHIRNLLISANNFGKILDMSEKNADKLNEQSKKISIEKCIYLINEFSELLLNLKYSNNQRVLLEVCFIKIISFSEGKDIIAITERINKIEDTLQRGDFVQKSIENIEVEKTENKPLKKIKSNLNDMESIKKIWNDFVKNSDSIILQKANSKVNIIFSNEGIVYILSDDSLVIYKIEERKNDIEKEFNKYFEKNIRVLVMSEIEYKSEYDINPEYDPQYDEESEKIINNAKELINGLEVDI